MTEMGSGMAGPDLEGRASRRQGPDRQRRNRDQRGRPAAAVPGPGKREDPEERRQSVSATGASNGARSSRPSGPRSTRAATEAKAREFLQRRFEACYPFHPATLSVFQRKWQALPQYQQTRGTLAMLAQWISIAAQDALHRRRATSRSSHSARHRSAESGFRSVVLGQLGESRLVAAIDTDIAGEQAHSRALDADTNGPLRDIHRRVGTAILFESSGGQTDKVAHLPELRFALGEPELDTTSIDNAAFALEDRSYFIRKAGSDGFRIGYQPTMKKVVSDRRASLDEETEVKPAVRKLVEDEFRRGASIPVVPFPQEGAEIPDTPRLTLVVADPEHGVVGRRRASRRSCRVDPEAREVAAALSGRARLVPQEARPRSAREGRARARVEARRARGRRGHARR